MPRQHSLYFLKYLMELTTCHHSILNNKFQDWKKNFHCILAMSYVDILYCLQLLWGIRSHLKNLKSLPHFPGHGLWGYRQKKRARAAPPKERGQISFYTSGL